jgi:hypothetical protein
MKAFNLIVSIVISAMVMASSAFAAEPQVKDPHALAATRMISAIDRNPTMPKIVHIKDDNGQIAYSVSFEGVVDNCRIYKMAKKGGKESFTAMCDSQSAMPVNLVNVSMK